MRRRLDEGVALVEAAFAIPVLFLFIAGIIDLGMWAYNGNQAANAARDGARLAILDYETADVVGSPAHQSIVAAIEAHLPGRTLEPSGIDVSCVQAGGGEVAGGCASADPAEHRVRVEVGWSWDLVTPLAGAIGVESGAVTGTANMVILGLPLPDTSSTTPTSTTTTTTSSPTSTTAITTTTTAVPACTVTALATNPATVASKNNGTLSSDVAVGFAANGAGCVDLRVQVVAPGGGSRTQVCGCGTSTSKSWTYGKNDDHFWTPGSATVRVLRGASVVATTSFTLT